MLGGGDVAKRKYQVGVSKEKCQNILALRENVAPITSESFETVKELWGPPPPVPLPSILICTVAYLMQLSLLCILSQSQPR